jgi:hypothetical protein
VAALARVPGCARARLRGCPAARVPGCAGARLRGGLVARGPGCAGARLRGGPIAQVPGCAGGLVALARDAWRRSRAMLCGARAGSAGGASPPAGRGRELGLRRARARDEPSDNAPCFGPPAARRLQPPVATSSRWAAAESRCSGHLAERGPLAARRRWWGDLRRRGSNGGARPGEAPRREGRNRARCLRPRRAKRGLAEFGPAAFPERCLARPTPTADRPSLRVASPGRRRQPKREHLRAAPNARRAAGGLPFVRRSGCREGYFFFTPLFTMR